MDFTIQPAQTQSLKVDRRKEQPWRRWYDRAMWRNLRTLVLARDPVCMICHRYAATIADHIIPHKGVWELFCDLANLQGLCKPCHDVKTASEDGGFANKPNHTPGGGPAPVATGEGGKEFQSSSVKQSAVDKALDFDVDSLLDGI